MTAMPSTAAAMAVRVAGARRSRSTSQAITAATTGEALPMKTTLATLVSISAKM